LLDGTGESLRCEAGGKAVADDAIKMSKRAGSKKRVLVCIHSVFAYLVSTLDL
jgi:hypothetical protein